jgi:hypothetical protein
MAYFGDTGAGWARLLSCQLLLVALLLPRLIVVGAMASPATPTNERPNAADGANERVHAWKAAAYEELLQERLQWCRHCLRLSLRLVEFWPYKLPGQAEPLARAPPTLSLCFHALLDSHLILFTPSS